MSIPDNRAAPRLLLIGATGQLGWELIRSLQSLGHVIATARNWPCPDDRRLPLDLTNPHAIREVVRHVRPQVIINAAAYTAVDRAEQEPDLAAAINAAAPRVLAEEAARLKAALVHYSSDYVFDGQGTRPWLEEDRVCPINAYGRTKAEGDAAICQTLAAHWIFRTSWVYGTHGHNFVKTMLRLGAEREQLRVVNDQHGAPTSARMLADVTTQLLAKGAGEPADFIAQHAGTYNLCCAGETTWRAFALEIFRLAREHGLPLAVRDVVAIASRDYPTPARRPHNSRLDCEKLRRTFALTPPQWQTALAQCLEDLLLQKLPHRPPLAALAGAPATPDSAARAGTACSPAPPLEISSARNAHVAPMRPVADFGPDIDVGVVYTHERYWLPRLLTSLAGSADGFRLRLLLVNNQARDWDDTWPRIMPNTKLLVNERRLGYAENLNRILQASSAPLVLLLNTDMSFDPQEQCLAKMAHFMRQHPKCGVSGCRLYHPDGTYGHPARRFQKLSTIAARRTPLAPLLKKSLDRYFYLDRPATDAFSCDWLSGCFLLVRREAYLQVGGFDEQFHKYFEDVDFCLRMARAGWDVMFNGGTFCYHYEQRGSRKLFSRDAWLHLRSYARFLRKWGLRAPTAAPSGAAKPSL